MMHNLFYQFSIFGKFTLFLFITLIIGYIIIFYSKRFGLLDYPNERKLHSKPVPYTGGIIFFIALIILIIANELNHYIEIIFLYSIIPLFTGLYDDKYKIQPATKLLGLTIGILILINNDIYIEKILFFNNDEFTLNLGKFSKLITVLFCLYIINAFNYSDGIDGLALSLFVQFLIFINLLSDSLIETEIYFMIILSAAIILFNCEIAKLPKVFLGNGGANLLGFLSCFLLIFFSKFHEKNILYYIWSINYLVNEFFATNLSRLIKNKPLFVAGRDHFHYIIEKKFKDKFKVVTIISSINVVGFSMGYFFYNYNSNLNLTILIFNFVIFYLIREMFSKN